VQKEAKEYHEEKNNLTDNEKNECKSD